jgi:hypothetical protein
MNSLPGGLRRVVEKRQEDLDDETKNFIDFEQGFDWNFWMVRHEVKRQTIERMTQAR